MALILFFVVILLLIQVNNKAQCCLLLLFYFLVVSLVIYNRDSQLNKNELCIFNHNQFLMTIKIRDKVFCFHEKKGDDLSKESFLLDCN